MLSFQLSAIDLILAIAVIILLILYITKLSEKTPTQEKLPVEEKKPSEEPATETTIPEEEEERKRLASKPQTNSTKCPYSFGYLKKLDKNASIPDKCLSCHRIMECFSTDK
jgi:hypothetical protein